MPLIGLELYTSLAPIYWMCAMWKTLITSSSLKTKQQSILAKSGHISPKFRDVKVEKQLAWSSTSTRSSDQIRSVRSWFLARVIWVKCGAVFFFSSWLFDTPLFWYSAICFSPNITSSLPFLGSIVQLWAWFNLTLEFTDFSISTDKWKLQKR